jgi:predicted Zn-dependent peptidase
MIAVRSWVAPAALALLACIAPLRAQAPLPDPFADVRHWQLANGLTLWVKPVAGAATTSISLAIPYGSDRDPPGHEELAHLVEHALFAGDSARTDEQITRDISDRGGSFNASTSPDRTLLWVSVGREHGPFALDWLFERVRPRAFDERIMPGVRDAVRLELGLGPRSLLGELRQRFLLHPALLPPGFWTREFGLHPPEYRQADLFESIQRTRAAHADAFYRRFYTPTRMSLLIAGDVDPERVHATVERTFGQLPVWSASPAPLPAAALRQGATHRYFWNLRSDVSYSLSFRIDSLGADDHVRLLFAQQLLEQRLLRRLRWGSRQSVYGVGTSLVHRGDATLLRFEARIEPAALGEARGIIEDELQRMRHGRYPPGEFELDRAALDRRFRLNNGAPAAFRGWHGSTFYRADLHPVLPPLGTRFAALTAAELATFARTRLAPSREILSLERPLPLREGAAAAIPLGAVLLGLAAARRLLVRPIDLTHLRYVARLRPPFPLTLLLAAAVGLALLLGLRLLASGAHHVAAAFLWSRDSFVLQAAAFVLAIALATLFTCGLLALVPRRLLVLEHEARIKYLAYRSRVLPAEDIVAVESARFSDVFGSTQLLRTVPLAFGWPRPAALIRTRRGADWFVRTRNSEELIEMLRRVRAWTDDTDPTEPAG